MQTLTKLCFLILSALLLSNTHGHAKPQKILVKSVPVSFSLFNKSKVKFDKLKFLGGLELSSDNKKFGGLSGLILNEDGSRMIAVSDRGRWFGAEIIYKAGKINGVRNVLFDHLTDNAGNRLRGKGNKDAESISTAKSNKLSGGVLVAFERKEKLFFYRVKGHKILSPARKIPLPNKIRKGPHNKELETVVRFHQGKLKGNILIFSENHRDEKNNIRGWILHGKKQSSIYVKPSSNFHITDAAILPNGDLLLLERAVSRLTGLSMQIRLIKQEKIKAGAILDGEILIQATQLMTIDNMEGMSIHMDKQNRTIISLISDDNFENFQRTLLLQFEIPKAIYNHTNK